MVWGGHTCFAPCTLPNRRRHPGGVTYRLHSRASQTTVSMLCGHTSCCPVPTIIDVSSTGSPSHPLTSAPLGPLSPLGCLHLPSFPNLCIRLAILLPVRKSIQVFRRCISRNSPLPSIPAATASGQATGTSHLDGGSHAPLTETRMRPSL